MNAGIEMIGWWLCGTCGIKGEDDMNGLRVSGEVVSEKQTKSLSPQVNSHKLGLL